jgi:hypothetical protein
LGAGFFDGDFPAAADFEATGLDGALAVEAGLAGVGLGFAVALATLRAAGLGALFLLATALEAFALLLLVSIAAPSVPELIHVHAVSQGAIKPTPVSICSGWFRS